jgi:hypothetical protein
MKKFPEAHTRAFSVAASFPAQPLAELRNLVQRLGEAQAPLTTAKIALQRFCNAHLATPPVPEQAL